MRARVEVESMTVDTGKLNVNLDGSVGADIIGKFIPLIKSSIR